MFSPFAFVIGSSSPLSASSSHIRTPYTPRHSSPLAPIPSSSSPIEAAKARRRAQYKAGPSARMCPPVDIRLSSPQTASRMFLKEKFRARCQARLKKAQERAAKRTPWMSSSDGFECEDEGMDDEDENPDDDLDDELFRRVMMRDARRMNHKYNISYEKEVGSEFDISYHDPAEIEREFMEELEYEEAPYDPEEELEAYIEEYSKQKDSEGDFEMDNPLSTTKFRSSIPDDPFTTPQRIQKMAIMFPSS